MSQVPSQSPSLGDLHDEQIVALLRSGAHANLLAAYFGELEYRELAHLSKLAATRRNVRGPLVYILPGIMGSRLGTVRNRSASVLWLHPTAIAEGGLTALALPGSRALKAVGVMLPGYLKLKLTLEIAGFRPIFYPFDWRADLDRLGRAFARVLEREGSKKVLVVGHSMGGLVARAALRYDRKRHIARLVQLGAPNNGSFAPVQALRAVYPTVRKIAALDRGNDAEHLARTVFRTLPGLYQLLPSPALYTERNLFDANAWPADDLRPDARLLDDARRKQSRLAAADERCALIAGVDQETIVAVNLRDGAFEYVIARAGDGTVPLSLALWPQAPTWYVHESHGALPNNNTVLRAATEILKQGTSGQLPATAPVASTATRTVDDRQLRAQATHKVEWDSLSLDSRRRILEPTITAEFAGAAGS
jgi:pimeloyl-ACP methyl ester carboxylesterase